MCYSPESQTGTDKLYTLNQLQTAFLQGNIIESRALQYNSNKELVFDLGACTGIMPFEECAMGIREGLQKDIAVITRVGRCCKFVVKEIVLDNVGVPSCILSRTMAQQKCRRKYLDNLQLGQIINCTVTYIESFGAFCDVGCGISALLPIDCISISRISYPGDRLCIGQNIFCVVKQRDDQGRLVLSMRELLGTWQQNADNFKCGETVLGVVRSIESYGVFVELAPNLAGLAEITKSVKVGQTVSVFIKSILPEKMKIKLVLLSVVAPTGISQLHYTQTDGIMQNWIYSTKNANKLIQTIF